MGRPYADEIGELHDTYKQALETPIDGLVGFVNASMQTPLRAVGSGGSATACVFASVLHEQATYMVSRHATPLEQLDANSSPGTSVLLVSAGGNNKDIIAAFERASSLDRNALGVLCASGGRGLRTEGRNSGVALGSSSRPICVGSKSRSACVWRHPATGNPVAKRSNSFDTEKSDRTTSVAQ